MLFLRTLTDLTVKGKKEEKPLNRAHVRRTRLKQNIRMPNVKRSSCERQKRVGGVPRDELVSHLCTLYISFSQPRVCVCVCVCVCVRACVWVWVGVLAHPEISSLSLSAHQKARALNWRKNLWVHA